MSRADVVGIVGAGRFATALAYRLEQAGRRVLFYSQNTALTTGFNESRRIEDRHSGLVFGDQVRATSSPSELCEKARLLILATSSNEVEARIESLASDLNGGHMVIHTIGGLVLPRQKRVSEVIEELTPCRRIGVLAGPAFPNDLIEGNVAAMVCASRFDEVTTEVRRLLNLPPALRIYRGNDLIGVELSSALVGAYAVALAVADELSVGMGPRALLTTRIISEMTRLVVAVGGQADTLRGLAGLGNLLVRGNGDTSHRAPSYVYGRRLAQAQKGEELPRPEGARAVAAGVALAKQHRVAAPILGGIATAMTGSRKATSVARSMMALVADVE